MTAVLPCEIWPPKFLSKSLICHSPPSSKPNLQSLTDAFLLQSLFDNVVEANSENFILRVEFTNGDVNYYNFLQCQCKDYEKGCHCFENAESCIDQQETRLSLMAVCSNVRRLEKKEHHLVTTLYHPEEIDEHLDAYYKQKKHEQEQEQKREQEQIPEEEFLVFQMD